MNPTIVPFVKWVGGKRQLLSEIEKRMPSEYNTYYEPFIGGGALFFHIQPEKAVINDLNKELINTYRVVKSSYKRLREYLILMQYGHGESFFKKIRQIDRNAYEDMTLLHMSDSKELRAARFIYLNKTGFNGLYRVNKAGYFNVPSGKKSRVKTHVYPNLTSASKLLKNTTIKSVNYETALKTAVKGDFVYLDPPYDYEKGQKGFDAYQKEAFGRIGQMKLANVCLELDARGVRFMLSNHNTELIRDLYKDFNIDVIKAKRLVGGKGATRNDVEEVLVRNYE